MKYHSYHGSLQAIAGLLVCVFATSSCVPAIFGAAAGATATIGQDERTAGTIIDDERIEIKAQTTLQAEPELTDDRHINVTSYNGIVLLTGEIISEQQRELVAEIVSRVEKVRKVHNYIQVGETSGIGGRSKDTAITTAVKGRMVAEKDLKSLKVKIVTEASVVYLMGIVNSEQAHIATEVARTTRGVQKVVRLFEIKDS